MVRYIYLQIKKCGLLELFFSCIVNVNVHLECNVWKRENILIPSSYIQSIELKFDARSKCVQRIYVPVIESAAKNIDS